MSGRFNYVIDTYLWSAASALAGMSRSISRLVKLISYPVLTIHSCRSIRVRRWFPPIRYVIPFSLEACAGLADQPSLPDVRKARNSMGFLPPRFLGFGDGPYPDGIVHLWTQA